MYHVIFSKKNKQQKHPKVHSEQYLTNINEPLDTIVDALPQKSRAKLIGDGDFIKKRIRRIAKIMRSLPI